MMTVYEQIARFRMEWEDSSPTLSLRTSGSTGEPKEICVQKRHMVASARRTCSVLGVQTGDTSLLCMPLDYIAGRMVCVRAWECGLQLIAVEPSLHPLAGLRQSPSFAAMTPTQVYETLQVPAEATLLRGIRVLLIGGGGIGNQLAQQLQDVPGAWSTYGMTETLSHIALRRVSEPAYRPLPGVRLTLDGRGCLVITDETVGVHDLVTNDMAQLLHDGSFRIIGRADNIVCSGGLKWQLEELENRLSPLDIPFLLTSVPDERLGEALVLLYKQPLLEEEPHNLSDTLRRKCQTLLPKHAVPRHYLPVPELPYTATGKPDRAAAKRLASAYKKP